MRAAIRPDSSSPSASDRDGSAMWKIKSSGSLYFNVIRAVRRRLRITGERTVGLHSEETPIRQWMWLCDPIQFFLRHLRGFESKISILNSSPKQWDSFLLFIMWALRIGFSWWSTIRDSHQTHWKAIQSISQIKPLIYFSLVFFQTGSDQNTWSPARPKRLSLSELL